MFIYVFPLFKLGTARSLARSARCLSPGIPLVRTLCWAPLVVTDARSLTTLFAGKRSPKSGCFSGVMLALFVSSLPRHSSSPLPASVAIICVAHAGRGISGACATSLALSLSLSLVLSYAARFYFISLSPVSVAPCCTEARVVRWFFRLLAKSLFSALLERWSPHSVFWGCTRCAVMWKSYYGDDEIEICLLQNPQTLASQPPSVRSRGRGAKPSR